MDEPASSSVFANDNIDDIVPSEWKYKVTKKLMYGTPPKLEISLKVALFTQDDIEAWVRALEKKTHCNYSIVHTRKVAGQKLLFKRYFHCHHRTRNRQTYPSRFGTKNTNCPSKLIISLLKTGSKKYQEKGKLPPDPKMPCVIDYVVTHNHSPVLAARFRKVPPTLQQELLDLFARGHSASTAYETIRVGVQINNPTNYEELLVNRSVCPDRNYCHKWYNEYKRGHGSIDPKDKTFLTKRLQQFNADVGEECASFQAIEEDYVIVLCPPLFKRVHQYIKSPSEIVFMAAINPADNDGSKSFFLMTHSECGALPLGIIMTSCENAELIELGLLTLRNVIGESMFFGRKEGPQLFIVDDCEAEQIAICNIWTESNILFCSLHILHTLWRYLLCAKNGLNREDPIKFFEQFRMIMVADTVDECNKCYNEAILAASEHPSYLQILEAYWERKDMWAFSYRNCILPSDNLKIKSLEATMCILKEPIFHRMRSFNVIQLVDFVLTKFVDFYTFRLLDAAYGRVIRDMSRMIPIPPEVKHIEQINSYLHFVPSLKLSHIRYYVNTEIGACTCLKNTTGYICSHIGWLLTMFPMFQEQIENPDIREIFHKTATGISSDDEDEEEMTATNIKTEKPKAAVVEQLIIAGNEVIKLEIVKEEEEEEEESKSKNNMLPVPNLPFITGVLLPLVSDEQALEAGEKLNRELFSTFQNFLRKSPVMVTPTLQQMLNKTKSLKSVDDFLAVCRKFSEGDSTR